MYEYVRTVYMSTLVIVDFTTLLHYKLLMAFFQDNLGKLAPERLLKQETMGWQWHQLDHMQITCTTLQTDNHASTQSFIFLQDGCSSWCPTNSAKALKAVKALLILQRVKNTKHTWHTVNSHTSGTRL